MDIGSAECILILCTLSITLGSCYSGGQIKMAILGFDAVAFFAPTYIYQIEKAVVLKYASTETSDKAKSDVQSSFW